METATVEKKVWKECGRKAPKIREIINGYTEPKKILIVFWHGVGDLLMFLPLYNYLRSHFNKHNFDLGLLPGVGHKHIVSEGLELPEVDFVKDHDVCFVISFPMIEGSNTMTKVEHCARLEIGFDQTQHFDGMYANITRLPQLSPVRNKLIGVHFQGTCLPGSTNPHPELAKQIWDDLVDAGYVPIDLHFEHVFHNPVNKRFPWSTRTCRELKPSLETLQMVIERCFAVVAVASGPFVISMCVKPQRTVYLQKHHTVDCYIKGFTNVVDIRNYKKENLLALLEGMHNG